MKVINLTHGKNPNTSEYWNSEFETEGRILFTEEYANYPSGYRWDALRFGIVGSRMRLRGKFLDIACGLGHFCRYIKARNPELEIWGMDFSPVAINYAKKIAKVAGMKINFIVGNAQKLPFEDNSFDIVSAQEVIEHLNNPDLFLEEIKRILKLGGKAYITTPWKELIHKGLASMEHIKEWTPREFSDLVVRYFPGGEIVLPPTMVDAKTGPQKVFWFLVILTK